MAVLASKLAELTHELYDAANLVGEFRLHAMKREITALYAKGDVDEVGYHHVLNGVFSRLGDWNRAVDHALKAVALRDGDVMLQNNAGVALLQTGDPIRAATLLAAAAGGPNGHSVSILANLAEAFAKMDAWPEARETLTEAITIADLDNVDHLYRLADAAGAVAQYERAVEFFARFLARRHGVEVPSDALSFIDGCPDEWWIGLRVPASLDGAVARMQARRQGPAPAVEFEDDDAEASALEVFEAMRPYRDRANKAVLPDG